MAVLEPVVATLTVNTAEFTAGLEEAKAQMAEFGAGADLAGTEGDLAGLGAAGKQAGADIEAGAGDAALGLGGLKGASEDAKGGLNDAEGAAKDASKAAEDSGGKFGILANVFGNMPGPIGEASSKTKEFRGSIEDAGESSGGFASVLGDIPVPAVIAGAAIAGVAAVSVDLASKYQTVTNQIAASEGITTGAATRIGQAFLTTAGTTTMSAQQIATAFAGVAGQAKQINGSALSAGQSLGLMKSAIDLAEASGTSLTSATSALTTTLQAFGLGISSSPLVSNVLYSAANATGQSVTSLGAALDKVKTKLGGMAPPIQQLGGLLVDLTSHGETGRAAMSALTTTFTNFLKPAAAVATAQNNLKVATDALPPSLKALAAQVQSGAISSEGATTAAEGLGASQAALFSTFTSANSAMATASEAAGKLGISTVTATGQMKPMSDIIAQLHDKIQGMGTAQATAELTSLGFGNASAKLVATIQAGPAAYDKYVAEVEKTNAAHAAAEKATSGMDASFEKAKSAIEDAGIALGEKLMPYVTEAAQQIAKFAAVIVEDWPEISTAFKVAFAVIVPIIKGMIDQIKGVVEIITGLVDFVKDIFTGKWGAAWDAVKQIFHGFADELKGMALQMFGPLEGIVQNGIGDIARFFAELPGRVVGAISGLGSSIDSAVIQPIVGFFAAIPGEVAGALGDFFSVAFSALTLVLGWINTNVWTPISGFFTALPGKVAGIIGDFFSVSFAALTKVLDWLDANVWTPMSSFFSGLADKVAGDLSGFISTAFGALTGAWQWIYTNVYTPIVNGFGSLGKDIGNAISGGVSGLAGAGKAIIDGIISGVNTGINFVDSHIPSLFGVKLFPSIPDIPLMAAGGIVTQPTLAIIGEAGPEAVIPIGGGGWGAGIAPLAAGSGGGASNAISAQIVNQPINVNVNGQTLAQIVTQFQLRGARATGNIAGQYAGGTQTGTATSINTNAVPR